MTLRDVLWIHMMGNMRSRIPDNQAESLGEHRMHSGLIWALVTVLLSSWHLLLVPICPAVVLVDCLLGLGANLHFVQVGLVLRGQPLCLLVVVVLSLPQSVDRTALFVASVVGVPEVFPLRSC